MSAEIREIGRAPRLEQFSLNRVDPVSATLETTEQKLTGLPLFDASFTGADGVTGRLGLTDDAEIRLVTAPSGGVAPELEAARRSDNHAAIALVTIGEPAELAVRNAPDFLAPHGQPVLQLSGVHYELLDSLAEAATSVRLVADATRNQVDAANVVTEIEGRDRSLNPLVVMTPRSGWWGCAAERGGGIACWLEIMRSFASQRPGRDVVFLASSGHELGHLGLKSFLQEQPDLLADASSWIHLGASIGARLSPTPKLQSSDREMLQIASVHLSSQIQDGMAVATPGARPGGEAGTIHGDGVRYVSVVGGHALFHHEPDHWPEAVDSNSVAGYAAAFVEIARQLAN